MERQEKNNFIISADIGGSHITAAIIDVRNKVVLRETQIRTYVNCHGSAAEVLETWTETLREVRKKNSAPVYKLALAMPGPFDYHNGISLITGLQKYESLYGIDVKSYLANALEIHMDDITFRNDAEAFLHGEVVAGAGSGFKKVIGFTLGTGMGSAVSDRGQTTDANWGSEPFGDTIADDYFSTRWFLKAYAFSSDVSCSNVRQLADLAETDEKAVAVFEAFAKNFADFMCRYLHKENPDLVIIGGNITKGYMLFLEQLKIHLAAYIDPNCLVISRLEEDAALIGAAFTFEINDLNTRQLSN